MYTYSFEKLGVWQDARKFTVNIYKTTGGFPSEEKFGLTNQIRRIVLSCLFVELLRKSGQPDK